MQEFQTALALLALAGSRSCHKLPPVVHTIAQSRSSSALQNHVLPTGSELMTPEPLDMIKWLFLRMYNAPVSDISKLTFMNTFRRRFARDYKKDGKPKNYLVSRRRKPVSRPGSPLPMDLREKLEVRSITESDWVRLADPNGREYYWNKKTCETQWEKPFLNAPVSPSRNETGEDVSSSSASTPWQVTNGGVRLSVHLT